MLSDLWLGITASDCTWQSCPQTLRTATLQMSCTGKSAYKHSSCCLQTQLMLLVVCCRFPPVCIDVDTLIKGVEEGQLAVRRALTPYAGSVPPAAVSDSPQSSSRASESESLDMLESLASAELEDESGSSGDESDEEAGQSQSKLQERYKWLLQQRAALQQQLEKLQNGRQTEQKETT